MANTFIHAVCNKSISHQIASEIEGVNIISEQGSTLLISVEAVEDQTEYWREYFYREQCQRDQALIAEIDQSQG